MRFRIKSNGNQFVIQRTIIFPFVWVTFKRSICTNGYSRPFPRVFDSANEARLWLTQYLEHPKEPKWKPIEYLSTKDMITNKTIANYT